MVLARKCRPKCLADLVGQPSVVRTLTNALKNNRLHHAYLFVGKFGSGKTSAGRILAASENCKVSPGLTPCGKCDLCKKVFEGKHTDIAELDAASKAGKVDQIRQLTTNALYAPVDGAKTKYFIIDECHAMSQDGSEALLKILEEPPPHVRFVLCTTELEQMRGTIVSRCQTHEFRQIYWREIADHLVRVAKQEELKVEEEAINLCARLAGGSMRTALQYVDKLLDFAGSEPATTKMAHEVFSTVSDGLIDDLLDQVIGIGTATSGKPDATQGFLIIQQLIANGVEFHVVYEGIARHLSNLLVATSASKARSLIMVSEEGARRLNAQLQVCAKKLKGVLLCLKNLHEARSSVEYGLSPETALQGWFIESAFALKGG